MFLRNQKGIALISVLIILTVASLLGTTVYFASSQETLSAERDENQTQAYYFARSGVEMAIGLIKNNYFNDLEKTYYGKRDGTFSETEINNYDFRFTIKLTEDSGKKSKNDHFTIESIGIVRNGLATGSEAQSGLCFGITRENINSEGNGGGGSGGSGSPLALFSKQAITLNSSARINGNAQTNSTMPGSVKFEYHGYITNGDLYIGPGADEGQVVTFTGWGRGKDTNIPNGNIYMLPTARNFPLPPFQIFPDKLTNKGTLKTDQEIISGAVRDKDGNGIGSVTIYLSPSIPGNLVKSSLLTTDNIKNPAGHGTWTAYTDKQWGTVIVTPYKEGYSFSPSFLKVTGPKSNVNFVGVADPKIPSPQFETDTSQTWGWEIEENGYYDTISVTSNRTLYINLKGETREIRVKNLNIEQGKVILVGEGNLILYVDNKFTIGGSSKINVSGNNNKLTLFYNGKDSLTFEGSTEFVGNIYAKEADISITGSNNIKGNIITGGNSVTVSGAADATPRILYAPNANLIVTGSGAIKGTVVVSKCTVEGGDRDAIAASNGIDTSFFDSLFPYVAPSLFTNEKLPIPEPSNSNWQTRGNWKKI